MLIYLCPLIYVRQTSQSALKIISLNLYSPDPVGLLCLKDYSLMRYLTGAGISRAFAFIPYLASHVPPEVSTKGTLKKHGKA
jgi:hypothetical protein